ncbi:MULTISPECIES: hypothetical protein [unclassified Pseudomonas]|uniref:hypothetical protein n=1 Tax=unclassified Pseudomonas TaxID=196821 RepID=UPI000C868ECE|nr:MULTISPECIES: hypothetical protein [unclassified Pseudomonas]PMV27258.1 hypothetical protein C1X17_00285 [Pseudomonas sp. FW305-3-2-15-C-TSA2]PMV32513.1 hypothetical protein C1X22_00285 [Pseudomonas sp. DP16D-L5]PMV42227.1 hypothetical protein C1X21_00285 [Pseudomonas sp. FW305-3-2-15-A-LB2]PMV49733.1 hypothetical protein C1X16_02115 [Pseudomonas sp. FW305-3-2-15-C-R2A1]PMV55151.1 hypothetical protein C1X18_00285 [Pseudomonas sp. FW305-3-2-15-C-LB1]
MTWAPVAMRWPAQATKWMDDLGPAKTMAGTELESTAKRLAELDGLAITNPGPVGPAAKAAVTAGRAAMAGQMGQAPACMVITPFQSGVGQGRGYQRFLSAPNLLQLLADKLLDRAGGHALALMFLTTHYKQLANALARFNTLMPIPELQRAEKRARYLSQLETEKWELPTAAALPSWGTLPLERCTITQAAKRSLSGQLAALESYTADSSPLADLSALAARKAGQAAARDQQLKDLQMQLANPRPDTAMVARLIGPGSGGELRRQLLSDAAPGHEWVLCAGLLLVGPKDGLSFVQELVGL